MDQLSQLKRLNEAFSALASVITEIITERFQTVASLKEQRHAEQTIEPGLTKMQVAKLLQVNVRTIDAWMSRGYLPHYKIGRNVRFRISEIQRHWDATLRTRSTR